MGSFTPVATALTIIVVVTGIGAFIAFFRDRKKYRGYEDLMPDAERLAKLLRGESFRDGEDLVVSGNVNRLPTYVRFSHAETTPGVHIRMEAPANLRIAVAPRNAAPTEGSVIVKTGEDVFDARCVVRCDEPMQARMFVANKPVVSELQKLVCSGLTYFTVSRGVMELSELTIPRGGLNKHVADHIASMQRLVPELGRLPGADKIRIKPIKRERRLIIKMALLIGSVAALVGVIAATRSPKDTPISEIAGASDIPAGVKVSDAPLIPFLSSWTLASQFDFEGDASGWLRGHGLPVSGHVEANLTGSTDAGDNAYVLLNREGTRRLVIIANGQNCYDVRYPFLGVIARVPKANYNKISWVGRPPENPDGDGILITRNAQDRRSGLILYLSGGHIVSGVPTDYQLVPITE